MKFSDLPKLATTQTMLLTLTDGTKISVGQINELGGTNGSKLHFSLGALDNEEESIYCQDIIHSYKLVNLE